MRHTSATILLALVVHAYSAPQFITFKDGKLGVNFGGYHAGVGIGGGVGSGAAGGLYAEAGTPHGQAAKAGLGGAVDGNGGSAGGLFAGATAGGNVRASAGLGGGVAAEKAAGSGYASASAGNHEASSGLGGEASGGGSSGFSFSGTKSYGIPSTVVKETEVSFVPLEKVHEHKKVHTEFKLDAANEIRPVETESHFDAHVDVKANAQPAVVVKEVYVEPPPKVIEKTIVHTHYKKPHRHHVHKTAYIGGYIGGESHIPPPPPPPPVFLEKRVDVGLESSAHGGFESSGHAGAGVGANAHGNGGSEISYRKEVTFDKNQNFFRDIFNIPISTLQAVGNLLSNTAGGTSVSVQKSASVQAGGYGGYSGQYDSDIEVHPKHVSQSSSSSDAQITVQTPNASKFIDDIFAIPINTLGAVNKFLENNVTGRKRVQVTQDGGAAEPTRVRLGPHARRRANKHAVVINENPEEYGEESKQ